MQTLQCWAEKWATGCENFSGTFKRSTIKQHRRTPSVLTDGVENVATFTVSKFPKMLRKVLDLIWSCVSGSNN